MTGMTDTEWLVCEVRDHVAGDHKRGCDGRTYSCGCGYDDRTAELLTKAGNALAALPAADVRGAAEQDVMALAEKLRDKILPCGPVPCKHPPCTCLNDIAAALTAQLAAAAATERELREAHRALTHIAAVLAPGCRTMDELLRDKGYACDEARRAAAAIRARRKVSSAPA